MARMIGLNRTDDILRANKTSAKMGGSGSDIKHGVGTTIEIGFGLTATAPPRRQTMRRRVKRAA